MVVAYVVAVYDKCPPCPPKALCETCERGIYVADRKDEFERDPSGAQRLYLCTPKAGAFHAGAQYRFTLQYGFEKTGAGPWRRTGPVLVDFAPVQPVAKHP